MRLSAPTLLLRALLLLAMPLLAGCASQARNVLTPVEATAPGTSHVDMLVATTRSAVGAKPGEMFTGERGNGLSFA
jgi:esterase/lipase superfamily enzyme